MRVRPKAAWPPEQAEEVAGDGRRHGVALLRGQQQDLQRDGGIEAFDRGGLSAESEGLEMAIGFADGERLKA